MLQEDSNGESSFEFIEKKGRDVDGPGTGSGTSLSSISPDYSFGNSGNILSNVRPPTTLPDISIWTPPATTATTIVGAPPTALPPPPTAVPPPPKTTTPLAPAQTQPPPITSPLMYSIPQGFTPMPQPSITPAIPVAPAYQSFPQPNVVNPPSMGTQQPDPYSDSSSSVGFMDMVKGAFPGKGMFLRMAEKAKNSVDSIITTLDPQMSEYIYSGGDLEITVTSKNDDEVGAVREAFHSILGKAWVNGVDLSLPQKPILTAGFDMGFAAAEEKIEYSIKYRKTPTISIESILLQQDKTWYYLDLLLLKDFERQLTFQTFTQGTPLPVNEFLSALEKERPNCSSLSVEEKLSLYFQTHLNWQVEYSGVTRKETLLLAARALAKLYKNKIWIN